MFALLLLCLLAVTQIHAQGIPGGSGIDLTTVPGIAMGVNGLDVAAGALEFQSKLQLRTRN